MMMALGNFVFSLQTLAYQELQRSNAWRHGSTNRIGTNAALQYMGPGDETITLPGTLLPELAGKAVSLDEIRVMAGTGSAWALVEGTGKVYGLYVIENLTENQSYFFNDGTPRKIEFSIALKRVDDDRVDLLGNDARPLR